MTGQDVQLSQAELQERLEFALELSVRAAELIMSHYRQAGLDVELKGDDSPVTQADRGAEELMRKLISERYGQDGVLGEEFPELPSQSGCRWILDPVDGTKSFIYGVPQFGTLIGLEVGQSLEVGVCRFPALDEVVYAARGSGAWRQLGDSQPIRCRVSETQDLAQALFVFTEVDGYHKTDTAEAFDRMVRGTRISRGWGDCFGHMLVATGRADIAVDPQMNPWDAAALLPIVEEAGGHYLGWDGQATIYGPNGLSVNAALKAQVLEVLSPRPA